MRTAVIGGGVSGIAAAFYLHRAGRHVELFEASTQLGGRVGCGQLLGRDIELGGKNIGRSYLRFREFADAYDGGSYEPFGINTSQVVNNALVPISRESALTSLVSLMKLVGLRDFSTLVSYAARIKFDPQVGYLNSHFFNSIGDRCDHLPASHHFGAAFSERLLRPVSVRMNGAEPEEIYAGNLGSNIKMLLDSYEQLKGGLANVFATFSQRVTCHLGHKLVKLDGQGPTKRLDFERDGDRIAHEFDRVVLALPAGSTAQLVTKSHPRLAEPLRRIRYMPVATIVAKYSQDVFPDDIRAVVLPKSSALSNAGAYGRSDLDTVRYTFSGKAARRYLTAMDHDFLIRLAEEEASRYLPIKSKYRVGYTLGSFSDGLCAYSPFHHRTLGDISSEMQAFPNIVLAGDYIKGASIEACFESAHEAVRHWL